MWAANGKLVLGKPTLISGLRALIHSCHQQQALSWKLTVPVHEGELAIDLTLDHHGGPAFTDVPAWLLR